MYHYIYKISNPITKQYYYGRRSTNNHWSKDSYFGSCGYLKKLCNGKQPSQKRLPEWSKEVLLTFDNIDELIEYEAVVIGDKWKTDILCLNAVPGGDFGGGDASQMHNPEVISKRTAALKKFYNTPKGKKFASDLGKRAKGKKKTISDDFKKAQGERTLGRKWINDGVNKKLVKPEDLHTYLSNGWILGRPQCDKDKVSQKTKEAMKNRKANHNGRHN